MKEKLRVLFAAFEAAPFMKTGGLGDVAASLPGAVQCPTIEMRVVLPKLRQIPGDDRRIKTNSIKKYIGQGLPKLTPVEIVGYEVDEAGSPLALDNG